MGSCFRTSKFMEKADKRKFMIRNGKILLEKLIASSNGKHNPIRSFTVEELKAATDNFNAGNVTMKCLFYKLYKGFLQERLISVMKFEDEVLDIDEYCFNCIAFASQMSHKNVLKFLGCCLETQIPVLVYECVAYGTLDDRIHDPCLSCSEPLLLKQRLKIAMEIAHAVAYLHVGFSRPIVSRDIKTTSILLHEDCVAKLFDFTLSLSIPEGETHVNDNKVIGTFGFMAPEYAITGDCSEKSDVYSFGALLLELLTGKRMNHFSSFEDDEEYLQELVKRYVENNSFKEIVDPVIVGEEGLWPEKEKQLLICTELAFKCLSEWEGDRPTMVQVAKQLRQIYLSN